jgi:regulator of protease activity HflC (stomatin/prohibitin superfamily)
MVASIQPSSSGGATGPPGSDQTPLRHRRWSWWERNDINFAISAFVLVFLIIVLWPTIFVNIQSGHAGVYFSLLFGGTDTKSVRGEGFQLKFPWDTIYDYDIRLQQVPYEFSVISGDGLQLQIRVSVRCRPLRQRLAVLQKDIGPDYVQKIVIPQTQLALRTVAGSYSAEKLYSTSRGILEEAMDKTIERLTGKYILIDQILITGVYIPEALKRAIEAKLTEQQNVLQYDYVLGVAKKEAERKRIEAEGIRDFQRIVTPGISPNFLRWKGIEATLDLSKSANAKVIVIGAQNGLPLILDTSSALPSTSPTQVPLLPQPSSSPYQEPPVEKTIPSAVTNPGLLVPVPVATPSAPSASSSTPGPSPTASPIPPVTQETPAPQSTPVNP